MKPKIRVLIVDDSAIVRKILTDSLIGEEDIEVIGTAPDPYIAREKIERLQPDVVTLDIEMPRMDGLTFLKELMRVRPLPVIVISSLAANGCAAALEATERGAVEVLAKPGGPYSVGDLRFALPQKIRSAARARVSARAEPQVRRPLPAPPRISGAPGCIVAIGASTGGTEAIRAVLETLPENMPPVAIVQHIPPVFSKAFADRLDKLCKLRVKEAADGDRLAPGVALVAPGDCHMLVRGRSGAYSVEVKSGPRVCYQRPSVDVLFHSVAAVSGDATVAVLLTGMGSDGAEGMLAIRRKGGRTIAQDAATSVVYGMPKEAARLGGADRILPLDEIAAGICSSVESIERQRKNA